MAAPTRPWSDQSLGVVPLEYLTGRRIEPAATVGVSSERRLLFARCG
ncbi:hypothetical protein [Micromonospora taraxaci]